MTADAIAEWVRVEAAAGVAPIDRTFAVGDRAARHAVLLVHGASATAADFAELASGLAEDGRRCLAPLLPAHGRGELALGELRFSDLEARVAAAFDALVREHESVCVVGQSLGAVLGVRVAAERPCAGLVALAPAFRPHVGRRALALFPLAVRNPRLARATVRWQTEVRRGIAATEGRLRDVTCPVLALHSEDDDSVSPEGAEVLVDGVASAEKSLLRLHGQGHVLTAAPDRGTRVFEAVREFLARVSPRGARSGRPGRPPEAG